MRPIKDLVQEPASALEGRCVATDVVLTWSADGLIVEQPGSVPPRIDVPRKDLVSLQLSRSLHPGIATFGDRFFGRMPTPRHVVHLEVRAHGHPRLRFQATTTASAVAGLPYLDKPGATLDLDQLLAMAQGFHSLDVKLAHFDPSATEQGHRPIEGLTFSEGLAAFRDENGMWGFVDDAGKVVVSPQWAEVKPFASARAAVMSEDQKWGIIDASGAIVALPEYDEIQDFVQGTAEVKAGDQWQVLGLDGEVLLARSRNPIVNRWLVVAAHLAAIGVSLAVGGTGYFLAAGIAAGGALVWRRGNKRAWVRALPEAVGGPAQQDPTDPQIQTLRDHFATQPDPNVWSAHNEEVLAIRELMRTSTERTAVVAGLAVIRWLLESRPSEPHGAMSYEHVKLWPPEHNAKAYACVDLGPSGTGCIAPEAVESKGLDQRADVYSVTCLVYGMLSGRPVFEGPEHAVLMAHKGGAVEDIRIHTRREIPNTLFRTIERGTSRLRRNRHPNLATLASELRRALAVMDREKS